ncbi:MAG: formyltransferase family protein, partial [Patescibacteria group bacterium]
MTEKTVKQNRKFRVAFFGTPNFAVPALKALLKMSELTMVTVVTQPDKPVGRKQEIISPPVKKIAEKHQVPVCQPDRIKSVKFEKCVREVDLDVAIVVAYGKIIPQK